MKMTKSEVVVILAYLLVRGALVFAIGYAVYDLVLSLASELKDDDPNAALTALLGIGLGALVTVLGTLAVSIAASVLDYLRDRLGTQELNKKLEDTKDGG